MNNPMALRQDGVGLYLHIPFCERRCRFCAFFTRDYREDRAAAFLMDLLKEIEHAGGAGLVRGRRVETVYFGGGTPTTLSAEQLLALLKACRESFDLAPVAEISIEANPAGVDEPTLVALRTGGINRVSFGAQSFDDAELEAAGTPHRVADIARAVRSAREAGISTVSLDLMYGFPGQSPARWLADLEAAIALEPDHLSFYGLTIEAGTPYHRDVQRGRRTVPDEDAMADLYEMGRERLEAAGYRRYEVSNFARPGRECRHNLGYWTDREWLGLGPSAHSYLDGDRFSNVESLDAYHRFVEDGRAPIVEREKGTPELRVREAVAFGLRTVAGVRLATLKSRYHLDPVARFRGPIERLTRDGCLVLDGDVLRPSAAALAIADELAVAFL
jgi:oxygen-independent coproporphyrinogen-3 oxidase